MNDIWLQSLLVLALWVLLYHHIIYPILLDRLARARRGASRPTSPADVPADRLPNVAVVMPAYNEERYIAEKISNLAALDYPRDRLRIVIALDGSRDATRERAIEALSRLPPGHGIELIVFPRNRGKVAVLNDCISDVDAEIVALTDTSALMPADCLRKVAAHMASPDVGVVFATYNLIDAGSEGERRYTDYQTKLKDDESSLDSAIGGHGALYFIRRSCCQPMPPDTINDDFILPMSIVASGSRGVYDRSIVASELERTQSEQEFKRRVRIGAGNMQQTLRLTKLFDPRRPWLAFAFASGKGSRPFMPFVGLLAILLTAILAGLGHTVYLVLLLIEMSALAAAVIVILVRTPSTPRLLSWLGYLVEGHFASLIGSLQLMLGIRLKHWQPRVDDAVQH